MASTTDWVPWSLFQSLVVMNSSSRGMPDFSIARPDALLVAVGGGRVDVPVSDFEGVADDALRLVRIDEEHAESELGNAVAVIELESWEQSSYLSA